MADQPGRQSFRFRLPWVISSATQAPPLRTPAPMPQSQPSATSAPPLRPPFRPIGAAPPRPFIPRTESIPPSRVVSQPSSPTRPFQPPPQPVQVVPLPPFPARTATAPPSPPPPPSLARPIIATSPPPPSPESKTVVSEPPQLPSPSKIAAQLKSQEIQSPRSQQLTPRSVPAVEKKAESPPPMSLPAPALSHREKERKAETFSNGATRPTALMDSEAKPIPREPQKPRIVALLKKDEPEQRTIPELPSTNHRRNDRTPPSPPPPQKPITESQQTPTLLRHQDRPTFQKNIKDDVSRLVHKYGVGHPKREEDNHPVSVITLAGENRGATMQLGGRDQDPRKEGPVHIHRGYKLNPEQLSDSMTTDGENSSKDQKGINRGETAKASKSFVNSNVQSINNSIMFNSSYSERSPGVHLTFSRSVGQGSELGSVETRRAVSRAAEAQKLTYEPTVRRATRD